jgi:mRNA interferase HigB
VRSSRREGPNVGRRVRSVPLECGSAYVPLIWEHITCIRIGNKLYSRMRIIAKGTLRAFWESHPDAEEPLLAWHKEVEGEDWDAPVKVKAKYGNASIVADNRVVFNIKGNDYRVVVKINYPYRVVYIRFVGTHAEYDAINVEEV